MGYRYVGSRIPRLDARDKVSGREAYAGDLQLPGMAIGAFLDSPYPHARIVSIDTSAAERLPGVYCVLTQNDLTRGDIDPYFGPILRDQPILAIGKARYVGDPVAAVAAVNEDTAQDALDLIRVEYEELPSVLDPRSGLAPGAPRVHDFEPDLVSLSGLKGVRADTSRNICNLSELQHGDPDAAFASADYVLEDSYYAPATQGLPLEPHAYLAEVSRSGDITLWSPTQAPFSTRADLARMFGLPLNRVRVIVPAIGGGFGSKGFPKKDPIVVALARKAGVAVKMTLTSQQVFRSTVTRHACEARVKFGVNADGRIIAAELESLWDTGAYAETGPRVTQKAAYSGLGPYHSVDNVRIRSVAVYTNKVPAGAFRGYGQGQTAWAVESHMDTVARKLGMDPLQFRLRNLNSSGSY
jgi:CO/xanthine dehydrogenase Mo-binding subunit